MGAHLRRREWRMGHSMSYCWDDIIVCAPKGHGREQGFKETQHPAQWS